MWINVYQEVYDGNNKKTEYAFKYDLECSALSLYRVSRWTRRNKRSCIWYGEDLQNTTAAPAEVFEAALAEAKERQKALGEALAAQWILEHKLAERIHAK
jgi:hypothetical protein